MRRRHLFLVLVLMLAAGLPGCFRYDPHDLPGYDATVEDEPETTEMDTTTDGEDLDARDDREGPPPDTDAEDVRVDDPPADDVEADDAPAEDLPSDEFEIDWEVPPTCGNGIPEPPDEECDGDDPSPCTTDCGTEGTQECIACRWVCFPPPDDTCNGVDENCDTIPDDGYVPAATCGTGVCLNTSSCVDGEESCEPLPPRSTDDTTCDALDDDCSGSADEDYVPYACGIGVCRRDSVCSGGSESCTMGSPTGMDNDCNGLDDNCNGACDENYSTTTTCGVGPCQRYYQCLCGTENCFPGTPIAPTDTTCNGVDEDCSGTADEDWVQTACGYGVCQRLANCTGGVERCTEGSPTGTDQNCNGIDENCSGLADEGYVSTTCGVGGCQRSSTCNGGVESCVPGSPSPTDVCGNGVDDDCDGTTDEGCGTTCGGCTGSTDVRGTVSAGTRFTGTTSGSSQHTGSCGGSSAPEAFYHFTIVETSDIFISTHGTGFDTVVYVRDCNCTGTERACNDDADGLTTSMLSLTDVPAGTYLVFVDGKNASSLGAYQVDIYVTPQGAEGDRCGDPVHLTGAGATYTDPNSTCYLNDDYTVATSGGGVGDCDDYVGTGDAEEIVYYFFVPNNGTAVTFTTCGSLSLPDENTDTSIYVRSVCTNPGGSYQLACSEDNSCGGGPADNRLSRISTTLNRGLYYIIVDGYYQPADPPYSEIHTCGGFILGVTGL
jgi:hypothetical protein